MLHKNALEGDIHKVHNWSVANEAARTVLTLVAGDIGKVCLQLDIPAFFVLIDDSPATWVQIQDSTSAQAAWEAYADAAELAANGYTDGEISTLTGAIAAAYQPLDTQLTDLAALTYTGNALKIVRVNAGETGFEVATEAGSSGREILTAARTYYVRTDGSDSNTGLVDSAGGAFLTIQKAIDVISATLDMQIYQVTVIVRTGTYTTPVVLAPYIGKLAPILEGDTTTPSNCIISTTSASGIGLSGSSKWIVQGFKIQTTTSGSAIAVSLTGQVDFKNLEFGACASGHLTINSNGVVTCIGNYSIVGAAPYHIACTEGAIIQGLAGKTITITGTPAFSVAFLYMRTVAAAVFSNSVTFSGSATGTRYNISLNSVCFVNGASTSYLPGNLAGSTTTGAQYA